MALDKNCKEQGYLLGRLYAIIEHSINESLSRVSPNDFSHAMMSPYCIFPRLIARYHSAQSTSLQEQDYQDIMNELPSDNPFPHNLSLTQQGQFCIGRDHQLAEIYRERNRRKIAKAVKLKRVELELTQAQLSEKAGVTRQSIANIESGDYNVSIDVLSAVMAVLGINITIE